jgi:hypothetical protein
VYKIAGGAALALHYPGSSRNPIPLVNFLAPLRGALFLFRSGGQAATGRLTATSKKILGEAPQALRNLEKRLPTVYSEAI